MRKKLLLADLAVCSLWALFVIGSRMLHASLGCAMLLVMVVTRIALAFVLYHKEQKAWLPLAMHSAIAALLLREGYGLEITRMVSLPLHALGIEAGMEVQRAIVTVLRAWICLMPVVTYAMYMLRKGRAANNMSWQDACGAILWHDGTAKTYSRLMLLTISALLAGLAMDMRLGMFACVTAPTLSFVVLARHYEASMRYLWMLPVSMLIFYFCQDTAGLWRMWLLGTSFILMACKCICLAKGDRLFFVPIVTSLYLGVLLPCLAIGNNPYTCADYARDGFYYISPYRGVFVIKDNGTGKIGLRDRYGMLVKPEYDSYAWHDNRQWFGQLELRRNGYVTLYDVCRNTMRNGDDTDHKLQDDICGITGHHMVAKRYAYDDRMEVSVTDSSSGKMLVHLMVTMNGGMRFHYDDRRSLFIKACAGTSESDSYESGTAYTDECGMRKRTAHLSQNVRRGSTDAFTIDIKTARENLPQRKELQTLAKAIAARVSEAR